MHEHCCSHQVDARGSSAGCDGDLQPAAEGEAHAVRLEPRFRQMVARFLSPRRQNGILQLKTRPFRRTNVWQRSAACVSWALGHRRGPLVSCGQPAPLVEQAGPEHAAGRAAAPARCRFAKLAFYVLMFVVIIYKLVEDAVAIAMGDTEKVAVRMARHGLDVTPHMIGGARDARGRMATGSIRPAHQRHVGR